MRKNVMRRKKTEKTSGRVTESQSGIEEEGDVEIEWQREAGDMPTNTFRPPGGSLKQKYQRPYRVLKGVLDEATAEKMIRDARDKEQKRKSFSLGEFEEIENG